MKTFLIHQSNTGLQATRIADGASVSRLPIVRSESRPTFEECVAAWNTHPVASPATPVVPQTLTAWQARAALKLTPAPGGGTLHDSVDAAITAMPDGPDKVVIQTAWENNAGFSRTSPTILAFAARLGLTDEQLDQLFITGAKLVI